jgi:hypothetical protein
LNRHFFILPIVLLCCCISGCHARQDNDKTAPDQAEALIAYSRQKHRFEIRDCKLFYNEKQLLFYDSLPKYEKIFGNNYVADGSNLYYKDVPVSFNVEWANLLDRQKGKPGAEKDSMNIVNSINVWLSYPDDIDKSWGPYVDVNKYIKHQKLLEGYVMIDSVLLDAGSDIDDINHKLSARTGYAKIQSFHGSLNSLGYVYYYPEANSCTPITDQGPATTTTISVWLEDSKKITWLAYGYTINDRAPDAAVEKRLQDVDSALQIKTDHNIKQHGK